MTKGKERNGDKVCDPFYEETAARIVRCPQINSKLDMQPTLVRWDRSNRQLSRAAYAQRN